MLKKQVAVELMRHLVIHDYHGYSQISRWGDGTGNCNVQIGTGNYQVEQGDRDCSSAIIDAFESAGISCGGATYTGNMRVCMCGTGNFRWHPMSSGYIAQAGDVYLNEVCHTAMCLSAEPDMLMEFCISETGSIDGREGDQTGHESHIRSYYDYPWNGILECINTEEIGIVMEAVVNIVNEHATVAVAVPEYRVYTAEDGWLEWMNGLLCSDGCGDDYAGVPGHVHRNANFRGLGVDGWFQLNMKRQGMLPKNQENTDMSDYIIGYIVYYSTDEPEKTGYYLAKYRVGTVGRDYYKWEYDDEDGGAGDGTNGVDRLQLTLEKE